MKKLISHRGLLYGPNSTLENTKQQIELALNSGYDVETDVRYLDGEWWIGHDNPVWKTDEAFIKTSGLWLHAKNLEALSKMIALGVNCFWHQNDDYTITSQGYIWAYPGKPTNTNTIIVMPEWLDNPLNYCKNKECYGICSDFISELSVLL